MIKSIAEFEGWLGTFIRKEKGGRLTSAEGEAKLATMRELCAQLGHPEASYKICLVAGSKGKGSTARMMAEILAADGAVVGVEASPYVYDFRERAAVVGGEITDGIYLAAANEVAEAAGRVPGVTWFELVTAWGLCCFRRAGCEWVILEAGIGGRYDATNFVADPEIAVITALERTHCRVLGETMAEIAWHKAGIMRPGVPVVVAKQRFPGAAAELGRLAGEIGAGFYAAEDLPDDVGVGMVGAVMREDAAAAALACCLLGASERAVREGLLAAVLPGRFEVVEVGGGVVVLDVAHTVESLRAVAETFGEFAEAGRPRYLLLRLRPENGGVEEMRAAVVPYFDEVFEVGAADYEKIGRELLAKAEREGATLLVTGSFYLVSAMGEILRQKPENVL